ncbi:MAG: cytochrome c family protein [Sedimentisphaerales bacterium]|nr:cytochrome c family protein [Sedimentisphaerales bacterium]
MGAQTPGGEAVVSLDASPPAETAAQKPPTSPPEPDSFVILFSGNWEGHLEPCGCTEKQLGGIDRRTEEIKKIAPDPQARLMLDAGPLIKDTERQSQLKFETFLYAFKKLNYDTINITGEELILLYEKLALDPAGYSTVICSNMPEEKRRKYYTQPYFQKTLRYQNHQLDCLVLSLFDPKEISDKTLAEKLQLQEPVSALQQNLDALKIKPDRNNPKQLIIVMLTVPTEDPLTRKLAAIAAIDIIVTKGSSDEPELCSPAGPLILTTGRLGKYISQVDVPFPDSDDQTFKFKMIEIHSEFPQDAEIVRLIDDYQELIRMENLIEDEIAIPRLPLDDGIPFAGNSTCQECHTEDGVWKKWSPLKHAHAMESLEKVKRDYNPECVVCHTVGMLYETGYRSRERTPDLANVGCEMCHGPGAYHNEAPEEEYRIIFTPCESCHDHENSPRFEAERDQYFENIKHWDEPREYWD